MPPFKCANCFLHLLLLIYIYQLCIRFFFLLNSQCIIFWEYKMTMNLIKETQPGTEQENIPSASAINFPLGTCYRWPEHSVSAMIHNFPLFALKIVIKGGCDCYMFSLILGISWLFTFMNHDLSTIWGVIQLSCSLWRYNSSHLHFVPSHTSLLPSFD